MRLFIAIQLPTQVEQLLFDQMENWHTQGMPGRLCAKQNLHLTLAFLGEQAENKVALIEKVLQEIPLPRLIMKLGKVAFLRDLCYVSILCPALEEYVQALRLALKEKGIVFETKKFLPHITLLRKSDPKTKIDLFLPELSFQAKCCTLFSSTLTRTGPIYTPLYQKFIE